MLSPVKLCALLLIWGRCKFRPHCGHAAFHETVSLLSWFINNHHTLARSRFVVIDVAADGLVLGARTFADTVVGKFRSWTCSWIIPQGLAGDVSVTCAIIGLWLMITYLTFQYDEFFRFYDTHVRMCVCVCACVCVCVSQARINHSVNTV